MFIMADDYLTYERACRALTPSADFRLHRAKAGNPIKFCACDCTGKIRGPAENNAGFGVRQAFDDLIFHMGGVVNSRSTWPSGV